MNWWKKQKLINGDDSESNAAYYCFHKLGWKPSRFNNLPIREKAFVVASIQIKMEAERKKEAELKRRRKRKR